MTYQSPVAPFGDVLKRTTIPQFISQFNPENIPVDKVIQTDNFNNDPLTYGGLRVAASRIAWGLRNKLDLKRGDILLALIPNSNDFVTLAHGVWWAGGIFSPLTMAANQADFEHAVSLVNPTHIAVVASHLTLVQSALENPKLGKPKVFTVLGKAQGLPEFPADIAGNTDAESLPPFSLEGNDAMETTAAICFSSGTTGKTKGVTLSHYNLLSTLMQFHLVFATRQVMDLREVWITPYYHLFGLLAAVILTPFMGFYLHTLPAFDLEEFCATASEIKATTMHIVPPIAVALALHPVAQKYDLSSTKQMMITAAPIKKHLQEKIKARFPNATVWQAYGMTEAAMISHQLDESDEAVGCAGPIVPGTELRIVDPQSGKDVEMGQEGEFWVRGPQVTMGYWNNEAATKATFRDGWLMTGDIGKMDKSGNLWVTDRLKEMIKHRGLPVSPSEMEDLLLQHPDVTDAAVCAIWDDYQATEVPMAYVSLSPEKAQLPDTEKKEVLDGIKKWSDGQVAEYKRFEGGVHHLQTLPKSPNGKILRRMLPAKLEEAKQQGE